jgi:hypothetical protein
VLFNTGLYFVTSFNDKPFFPGPGEPANVIVTYFQTRAAAACSFFHFGAAIVLGIFTAPVVSQLRFLGVKAAGAYIALFGGLRTSFSIMASATTLWTMAYPGVAQYVGVVLPVIRFRRRGLLGAARSVAGGRVRHERLPEALAEMVGDIRLGAGAGRRVELVQYGVPTGLFLIL